MLTYPQPSLKLTNGTATWLPFDHLGSVRAITAATGAKVESAIYRPFGEQSEWLLPGNVSPETKGWIGERYDADAGLQYLNARYYDPALGLFLQPDWFEVTKPGVGTNRFSYGFNDPVNRIDPSGNLAPLVVGIIAAVGYFSSVDPANAPGPGDEVLPPNQTGLYVGLVGGTVAATGIRIAATACAGSAGCSAAATGYAAAETTVDAVGCSNGDAASCGAAAIPGVSGTGVHAVEEVVVPGKAVASAAETAKSVANFSRDLVPNDLGLKGVVSELRGSFSVVDGAATMRVDMIRGSIRNPMEVVKSMAETAKANGATSLRIEGTIANERLYDALERRYGLKTDGPTDYFEVPLE